MIKRFSTARPKASEAPRTFSRKTSMAILSAHPKRVPRAAAHECPGTPSHPSSQPPVLLASLEHSLHAQRAVELAVEGQCPRGGKGDVQLHLALGRDVLVDAEGGNRDVVQSARLALHH